MLENPADEYAGQETALTADARAVLIREARGSLTGLGELARRAAEPTQMPKDLVYAVLSVTESRIHQLAQLCGVELDSAQAKAARHSALREANLEVARLEALLNERASGSGPQAQAVVAGITSKVAYWWEQDGLGYVRSTEFKSHGVVLTLSCSLDSLTRMSVHSDTPLSDIQEEALWLQSIRDRGFEVVTFKGSQHYLPDTPSNRQVLERLILEKIPSARWQEVRSTYLSDNRKSAPTACLRELTLFVSDYQDLCSLPTEPAAS